MIPRSTTHCIAFDDFLVRRAALRREAGIIYEHIIAQRSRNIPVAKRDLDRLQSIADTLRGIKP